MLNNPRRSRGLKESGDLGVLQIKTLTVLTSDSTSQGGSVSSCMTFLDLHVGDHVWST